jgi:hypothetical protein
MANPDPFAPFDADDDFDDDGGGYDGYPRDDDE